MYKFWEVATLSNAVGPGKPALNREEMEGGDPRTELWGPPTFNVRKKKGPVNRLRRTERSRRRSDEGEVMDVSVSGG